MSPHGFLTAETLLYVFLRRLGDAVTMVVLVHGSLYMPILLLYDRPDGTYLGLQMRFS